jgi:methyl-accepting chemotaxis protein
LLLLYLSTNWVIRNKLKPLRQLTKSAQRIAEGNYNEMLPYTECSNEIGLLQERFEQMQQSVRDQLAEMEEETEQLLQEGDLLRTAREKTIETDDMKNSFLNFVTLQMANPVEGIDSSVTTLCNNYHDISQQDVDRHVDNIQRKSRAMVELLNFMAHFTQDETGKEASHG